MVKRLYRLGSGERCDCFMWRLSLCGAVLGSGGLAPARAQDVPVVAAASDLQFALTEIAETFKTETRREVKLTFGSSGNFFRQIEQGAPFQLFLSADEQFVLDLAAKGLTVGDGTLYARGHIVIIAPHGSALEG